MTFERHIELDGQSNFRDVGGYETIDGRRVRSGQVYRSGRLTKLSDADVERLTGLGIRTVVNLLTEDDVEFYGHDRLPEGVTAVPLPIDSDTATRLANDASHALKSGDFSALPPEINVDIHRLLVHDGLDRYRELLELLADPTRRPLVFHCSHGIHRTGTGAAILLSLLGVPWDTVRDDYLLSNVFRADEVRARLEQLRSLAASANGIKESDVDMTNVEAFMVQQPSYIDASMDEIESGFGSVDGWATAAGVSSDTLTQLRAELLMANAEE